MKLNESIAYGVNFINHCYEIQIHIQFPRFVIFQILIIILYSELSFLFSLNDCFPLCPLQPSTQALP